MTARLWVISASAVLGLCVLNASLGDSTHEAQIAADHKSETLAAMNRSAKLEKQAHQLLSLDRLYAMGETK